MLRKNAEVDPKRTKLTRSLSSSKNPTIESDSKQKHTDEAPHPRAKTSTKQKRNFSAKSAKNQKAIGYARASEKQTAMRIDSESHESLRLKKKEIDLTRDEEEEEVTIEDENHILDSKGSKQRISIASQQKIREKESSCQVAEVDPDLIALLKSKRKKKKKKNRKRTLQPPPERKDPLEPLGLRDSTDAPLNSGHTKRLINKYLYGSQSVQRLHYLNEPPPVNGSNASFNLPSTNSLLGKHMSVGSAFAPHNLSFTEDRPHSSQQIDHGPPGSESQYVLMPDGTVSQTQPVRL